jgi:hypothetical protein
MKKKVKRTNSIVPMGLSIRANRA